MVGVASHMIGGEFQAADNPEFKNAIVLHRIEENPYGLYVTIPLDSVLTKYRYWRHVSPIAGYGNIARIINFGGKWRIAESVGENNRDGWYVGKMIRNDRKNRLLIMIR